MYAVPHTTLNLLEININPIWLNTFEYLSKKDSHMIFSGFLVFREHTVKASFSQDFPNDVNITIHSSGTKSGKDNSDQ